ncbi:MAG: LuxR family transcriptional regulator [Vicingaceae bacterium]|nr:LuxR family transcriptional regulator [Vicingaceae bacterium]
MIKSFSILLLFICSLGFSQETYLDTLKTEIEGKENPKQHLYNLLLSENANYKLAVISNALGLQFQRESNLDSAFYCHNKALEYALKVNDNNQEIGVSYNKIGVVYYYRGELDSAIVYFKKSIPYYQEKSLKANSYNNLAIMNKYNSSPDLAIENYLLAYDIYKSIKDTVKQVYVLSNIGALYNDLTSFDKAKEYLNRGILLAKQSSNKDGELNCKANLGKTYADTKNFDKAVPLLKECIAYYEENEGYQFLIVNKNNLANCFDDQGDKETALKVYLEILELVEETGIENSKEAILINVGTSYQELGDYEKALRYTKEALEFSKSNSLVLRYEPIYKSLSSIYQSMNNMDSSLYYKNLQIALRDSLDNVEREKKMMELEAEHQNEELNSDLKSTQSELDETEKRRALISKSLIYSLIIILITVFGVVIFYTRYKKKKLLSEELTVRNKKNRSDIKDLESTLGTKNEEIETLSNLKEKRKEPYPKDLDALTEREQEVLVGVQEGLKDQEIADKLFISITTVRTHLRKAYSKIDARNRAEAIQFISKFEI